MATDSHLKLLLDTHVWLWSLLDPARVPRRIARALVAARTEVWISPVTTWETLTLCRKGRLSLEPDPRTWIAAAREAWPVHDAPLTHDVALATDLVKLPHRDPADRFLAATARAYGLTLVTADENLLQGSGFQVLSAR
ncbi:MAG: type II toxin-antitoxin system VapC family toxin [Terriglobia bacterium]